MSCREKAKAPLALSLFRGQLSIEATLARFDLL